MKSKILVLLAALFLALPVSSAFASTGNSMSIPIDGFSDPTDFNNFVDNTAQVEGYTSWIKIKYNNFYVVIFSKNTFSYSSVTGDVTGTVSNQTYLRYWGNSSSSSSKISPVSASAVNTAGTSDGASVTVLAQGEAFQLAKEVKKIPEVMIHQVKDGGLLSVALIIFAILLGVGLLPRLKSWFLHYKG